MSHETCQREDKSSLFQQIMQFVVSGRLPDRAEDGSWVLEIRELEAVQVAGVVELLESAQDSLVRSRSEALDVARGKDAAVVDEGQDFPIAVLKPEG